MSTKSCPKKSGFITVITSCNRDDLFNHNIASFFKFNSFPIEQLIIMKKKCMLRFLSDSNKNGYVRHLGVKEKYFNEINMVISYENIAYWMV